MPPNKNKAKDLAGNSFMRQITFCSQENYSQILYEGNGKIRKFNHFLGIG